MSVLRLLTVYNEKDIIRANIEYYISQEIETIVLDNYSKDGTYEIIKEYEGKGVRWIERYKTDFYDIRTLNTILITLAKKEKENFFIWLDADEFLCPFDCNYPLKILISTLFQTFPLIDAFNASKVEFYHTEEKDIYNEKFNINSLKFFYFEKIWKDVIFRKKNNLKSYLDAPFYFKDNNPKKLNYKKLPYLFFIKHYPFRSLRQAKKKVFRAIPVHLRNAEKIDSSLINWHLMSMKNDVKKNILREKKNLNIFSNEKNFYKNFMINLSPKLIKYYDKIEKLLQY